jgi:hypothetical protein
VSMCMGLGKVLVLGFDSVGEGALWLLYHVVECFVSVKLCVFVIISPRRLSWFGEEPTNG